MNSNQYNSNRSDLYKSVTKSFSFWLISLILIFTALSSCTNDIADAVIEDSSYLTLSVNSNAGTRSNSSAESIGEIQPDKSNWKVLVFEQKNNQELLVSVARIADLKQNSSGYELKLKIHGDIDAKISLALLANYEQELSLFSIKGKTKTEVLSSLTFDSALPDQSYKWKNTENVSFPMWGETPLFQLSQSRGRLDSPIVLTRALARFDFGFNYSVNQSSEESYSPLVDVNGNTYSLVSIHIYNILDKGRFIPDPELLSNNQPSLPAGATKLAPVEIILSQMTQSIVKSRVYTPENTGGLFSKDKNKVTTFVFGLHNNSFSNIHDSKETNIRYFRADLTESGLENILPIVRNNRYVVNIKDIRGLGYETPVEAYQREINALVNVSVRDWQTQKYTTDVNGAIADQKVVFLNDRILNLGHAVNQAATLQFTSNLGLDNIIVSNYDKTKYHISVSKRSSTYTLKLEVLKDNLSEAKWSTNLILQIGQMKFPIKVE